MNFKNLSIFWTGLVVILSILGSVANLLFNINVFIVIVAVFMAIWIAWCVIATLDKDEHFDF